MAQIGESGCDTSTDWSPGALSADCLRDQDKLDFCGGGVGVEDLCGTAMALQHPFLI